MNVRNLHRLVTGFVAGVAVLTLLAACSAAPGVDQPSPLVSASPLEAVSTCASTRAHNDSFALGTLLPLSGSLSSLGPATTAGAGEALSEINAAGGVNGSKACVLATNSGDESTPQTASASVKKLLNAKVSAILGPLSAGVGANLVPQISAADTVMFAPADVGGVVENPKNPGSSTVSASPSPVLTPPSSSATPTPSPTSGIASKWYFQAVIPAGFEAFSLGKQVLSNGELHVAMIVASTSYAMAMQAQAQSAVQASGGTVVFGATGKDQELPPAPASNTPTIQGVLASKPDAVIVDAGSQTTQVMLALGHAGWPMKNTYVIDSEMINMNGVEGMSDLTGAEGAVPGAGITANFASTLESWYWRNQNAALGYFVYAPESYDAVMIMALAADMGGSSSSATIRNNIPVVTGSKGGPSCTSYADCLGLITKGSKAIRYQGPAGLGSFDEQQSPSSGYVSVYQYIGTAPTKFLESIKGAP